MEKRAREFLELSGIHYEEYRKKWKSQLKKLNLKWDDDIYNETIVSVYESINEDEVMDGADDSILLGYWYRSFINNLKRDKKYSRNSKKEDIDSIDVLKERPYELEDDNLYNELIKTILIKVKDNFSHRTYHLFKMYYLTPEMTYDELVKTTGVTDAKGIIMRVRKWLRENV